MVCHAIHIFPSLCALCYEDELSSQKVPGLAFLRFYCTYIRGNLTSCDAIGSSLKKDLPENLTDALFTKISFQESKLHFNDFHSWKSIQALIPKAALNYPVYQLLR